jgi:chromosome segregation ATPase
MLNTKGKYDDLVFEKAEINSTHKKLKPQFKGYLTRLLKNEKSQVSVLSDPIFLDSGATMQTLNSDKTFAFFFCSPEYYLAKMEDATGDGENIDQQECLDNWLEGASKMWEFYVCYPDSTLLINIEDVARDPWLNASKVFELLECKLDDIDNNQAPNSVNTTMANPIEKLSLLLLQNMKLETIKGSSELNERYENLAMTSILADSALSYDPSERAGMRLSECQKLITVISTSQVQLESGSALFAASHSELIDDIEKLKGEFTTGTSALETSLSERTAENELALLQINQLQKELETSDLNAKELKGEFTTRTSALETHLAELTAESELTFLQMNQSQEELSEAYSNSNQLESDLEYAIKKSNEIIASNAKLKTDITEIDTRLEESDEKQKDDAYWRAKNKQWAESLFAEKKQLIEKSEHIAQENGHVLDKIFQIQDEMEKINLQNEEKSLLVSKLESQCGEHETDKLQFLASNAVLQDKLKTAEEDSVQLRLTTNKLAATKESALLQISQLQTEVESLIADLDHYTISNKQLESQCGKHETDRLQFLASNSVLQDKLKTAEEDLLQLRPITSKFDATKESTLIQINQLQTEVESLIADLDHYTVANKQIESQNSDCNSENNLLKMQVSRLQNELEHYLHKCQRMTYVVNQQEGYKTDASRLKNSFSLITNSVSTF